MITEAHTTRSIDDLMLEMQGLTLVRPFLVERGASQAEVDAHTRELERVRRELVELVTAA